MGKWPLVRLGDVCEILSGYAFDSRLFTEKQCGMPIIRIRDINRGFTETYTTEEYQDKYVVKKGDLLIGMDGEFNIAPWRSEDALLNQRVCKVKSISDGLDERYLLYYMPKVLNEIERRTSYVTVKHLSIKTISQIGIPLPSLKIQKHIADTLDKTQEIIDGYKKQLADLDNLIKAVFYGMFGDIRFNERNWVKTKIGEVCHDSIEKLSNKENIEISYVDISSISNTEKKITTIKNFNSKNAPSRAKQILEPNDILVSTVRPNLNAVAINCINTNRKVIGSTGFCVLRCKNTINYRYLFEIVKSDYFINKLVSLARGASYPAVTDSDVKNIDIPIPPLDLQTKFADIVTKIEEQKVLVKRAITDSEQLFNSLMSKYFD